MHFQEKKYKGVVLSDSIQVSLKYNDIKNIYKMYLKTIYDKSY